MSDQLDIIDRLKLSRTEWRSRAETAEERIQGWIKRVEGLEAERDELKVSLEEEQANAARAWSAHENVLKQLVKCREALALTEKAEDIHANCDECGGEGEAEECEFCFPSADDARVARRLALTDDLQKDEK